MKVPSFTVVSKIDLVRGYLRQFHGLMVDDTGVVYENNETPVGKLQGFNIVPVENNGFELHLKIEDLKPPQEATDGHASNAVANKSTDSAPDNSTDNGGEGKA